EARDSESRKLGSESPRERLWNFLNNTKLESSPSELAFPGVASLGVKLKTDPSLREKVRAAVAARTTEFRAQARTLMAQLEARVCRYEVSGQLEHKYAGVIVLFDSLEKLSGLTHN